MRLVTALQLAGLVHLGLIAAGAWLPRAVNLRYARASSSRGATRIRSSTKITG